MNRFFILNPLLAVFLIASDDQAGEPLERTPEAIVKPAPNPVRVPVDLPSSRRTDRSERVTSSLQGDTELAGPRLSLPKTHSAFSRLRRTIREAESHREDSIRRLRGNIMAFDELLETTQARVEEAPKTPNESQTGESNTRPAAGDEPVATPLVEQPIPNDTNQASTNDTGGPSAESTQLLAPAENGGNEPIDRISMGDNLFATGTTATAMRAYSEIDTSALSNGDRLWVRHQLACCYRRLGESSKAESIFREIANLPDSPALAASARWWLDTIQRRKRLEQREKSLQEQLAAWEDHISERTKP